MASSLESAYEASLASSRKSMPSHFTAADTLSIANGNESLLDSAASTISNIPSFIFTSIVSGANALYNIPTDIGNAFGGDFERSKTEDVITSLDSDLGAYYSQHKKSTDLAGFLVSSIAPGTVGIKVLNAGQASLRGVIASGKFGSNMGKALGLLAPDKEAGLLRAIEAVATNSAPANLISRNGLRAMASGLGQGTLEALAFETAVSATLFKSPILENQDMGDFVTNVAFGAGIFGIVSGGINAVKLKYAISNAADTAALEANVFKHQRDVSPATAPSDNLALVYEQRAYIPDVPEELHPSRYQYLATAREKLIKNLDNEAKTVMQRLTNGDLETAYAMHRNLKMAPKDFQQGTVLALDEIVRVTENSKLGARFDVLHGKVLDGKASLKEVDEFMNLGVSTKYVRMFGEGEGTMTSTKPTTLYLSDTLKAGEKVTISPVGVKAGALDYRFTQTPNFPMSVAASKLTVPATHWNIMKATALETNARYGWVSKLPKFTPNEKAPLVVDINDIPMLEKVVRDVTDPDMLEHVRLAGVEGKSAVAITGDLTDLVIAQKLKVANELLKQTGGALKTQEEIAAIVNMRSSALSGILVRDPIREINSADAFALQHHAEQYTRKLVAQGDWDEAKGLVDIHNVPHTLKLTYNLTPTGRLPFQGINNFVVENMVIIKQQQKLYQEGVDKAVSTALPKGIYDQLEPIDSGTVLSKAVPSGAGHSFTGGANGDFGALASSVQSIGAAVTRAEALAKGAVRDVLTPLLIKLAANQKAAIEWSTLKATVRSIEGEYGLNKAGDALEPLLIVRWLKKVDEANAAGKRPPNRPNLSNPAMPPRLELVSDEVRKLAAAHIEINGSRTIKQAGIRSAQGAEFNRAPDVFYPIPVDEKAFPFFATVRDNSVTSGNHTSRLYATTPEELQGMINKLKDIPHLVIKTKGEIEADFRAEGIWDYEKSLNSNYMDTMLKRKGISAPYLVDTDVNKITADMLNWHLDRESGLVREAILAKYEVPFEELKRLGNEYNNIATSKFGAKTTIESISAVKDNPFADYIKTALALKKDADYPWWVNANRTLDQKVTDVLKRVSAIVDTARSGPELAKANELLKQAGYKGGAYDEEMSIFANLQADRGALTAVVQKANSVLAAVVIRMDFLNALTNAVSANVLLGAETASLTRLINSGGAGAVNDFNALTRINVPGTDKTIFAPHKLIATSMKNFHSGDPAMKKFYKDHGFSTGIADQCRDAVSALAYDGRESVVSWSTRVDKVQAGLRELANKGEKWTGNRLAEEFNRFVAADVMRQMTDVAIAKNLMTPKQAISYMNTFVNRTQGNYLASQRPMMFQGPIGKSIGLFQTYQFNLIQQLLRHVGEGPAKDTMTLLGLQGTIHGMNGLPGFSAINTHILGTASGNTEHKDAYTETYRAAGHEAGDWLLYGMASNMMLLPELKVNLYTRGDINPRHVSIVPTNPADVPIVAATAKVFANIFNTADKLGAGGDVAATILQGIEHNGLSRPLAGLAQTLAGLTNVEQASYSTTNSGNLIAANDLFSLANLGRIAGGKPLDEAVAMDLMYRNKAYAAVDSDRRDGLGSAIKASMIGGGVPKAEDIEKFAEQYAKYGGKQKQFNQWFGNLYKEANTAQANAIKNGLSTPYARSMQVIMGGKDLGDFSGSEMVAPESSNSLEQ